MPSCVNMPSRTAAMRIFYNSGMGIFYATLSPGFAFIALLIAIAVLWRAIIRAPWQRMHAPTVLSAWCAFIIVLPLLWRFGVPLARGLELHLLGLSLFALMFGPRFAKIGIALATVAYTAMYDGLWANLGVNLFLLAIFPAWSSASLLYATQRFLPHHIFIYLFANGFFGAMLVVALTNLAGLATFELGTLSSPVADGTIPYLLLLAFGEAFLTGFMLTILTVYRPQWVMTFDDRMYLYGK
jgi:uncharacterized membrane protein